MRTKVFINLVKHLCGRIGRNSTFHQLLHPIAHKHSHLLVAAFGQTMLLERHIAT